MYLYVLVLESSLNVVVCHFHIFLLGMKSLHMSTVKNLRCIPFRFVPAPYPHELYIFVLLVYQLLYIFPQLDAPQILLGFLRVINKTHIQLFKFFSQTQCHFYIIHCWVADRSYMIGAIHFFPVAIIRSYKYSYIIKFNIVYTDVSTRIFYIECKCFTPQYTADRNPQSLNFSLVILSV